jgi:hypothetical protein
MFSAHECAINDEAFGCGEEINHGGEIDDGDRRKEDREEALKVMKLNGK